MGSLLNKSENILNIAKRLRSMAEIGLMYAEIGYDIERYKELKEISFELMEQISDQSIEEVKGAFKDPLEYPTPNVDVRGVVLNEKQQILLVKEASDGKWTLPGGWCEIGVTPKENIAKEMKEETGLDVEVKRLLAVFDKRCHPHPPQSHYVYKLVFHCQVIGSPEFKPDYEITDIGYFDINKLPELSKDRILKNQLQIIHNKLVNNDLEVYVD